MSSSGSSNADLVNNLKCKPTHNLNPKCNTTLLVHNRIIGIPANGIVKTDKVALVMKTIDRADFCKHSPYQDSPQGIGYGVTISAPHMASVNYQFLPGPLNTKE